MLTAGAQMQLDGFVFPAPPRRRRRWPRKPRWEQLPLVVALLFAIVIALPLGIWVLAPLRRRATAGIAAVDERRRTDREQLQSRLRGDKPGTD